MKKENTLGMLMPKFKIGDTVSHPPNLYKETSGKITEISRKFNTCFDDLKTIDYDGLTYIESHQDWEKFETQGTKPWINPAKSVKYQWINENIIKGSWIGDYNGRSFYAAMTGYVYCVESPNMNTIFSERNLKLVK